MSALFAILLLAASSSNRVDPVNYLKQLHEGMTTKQVLTLMGKPDEKIDVATERRGEKKFVYHSAFGDISIYFARDTVEYIYAYIE